MHSHSKMRNRILCMHLYILFQLKLKNKVEFYTFIHAFLFSQNKKIEFYTCILKKINNEK